MKKMTLEWHPNARSFVTSLRKPQVIAPPKNGDHKRVRKKPGANDSLIISI
jgi:hypothetical protein